MMEKRAMERCSECGTGLVLAPFQPCEACIYVCPACGPVGAPAEIPPRSPLRRPATKKKTPKAKGEAKVQAPAAKAPAAKAPAAKPGQRPKLRVIQGGKRGAGAPRCRPKRPRR